jgi:hypothetical protein
VALGLAGHAPGGTGSGPCRGLRTAPQRLPMITLSSSSANSCGNGFWREAISLRTHCLAERYVDVPGRHLACHGLLEGIPAQWGRDEDERSAGCVLLFSSSYFPKVFRAVEDARTAFVTAWIARSRASEEENVPRGLGWSHALMLVGFL